MGTSDTATRWKALTPAAPLLFLAWRGWLADRARLQWYFSGACIISVVPQAYWVIAR